ncbi:MAG: 2OG-Fe(II) oxygenase [Acidiferrobacterales bacterium]
MLLEVYDNLVQEELIGQIFQSIHQPAYKFGQKSKPGDMFGFWITHITEEILSSVKPLNQLAEIVDDNITKGHYDVARMYVNAYNFGDCPTVHSDHDSKGFCTVLYYANPEWHIDWSGETMFYNQEGNDIIKAVYPKPGRIVFFDSRIPHAARTPSRVCDFIRYTIAMKLERNRKD